MNITLEDLQNQIHGHSARLKALERVQQPAVNTPPPPLAGLGQPVMDNPAEAAWYAKAESDPNVQRLLELEAEVAKLTERAGFLNNEMSQATLTIQQLQIILKQPLDQTQGQLVAWATHIMEAR